MLFPELLFLCLIFRLARMICLISFKTRRFCFHKIAFGHHGYVLGGFLLLLILVMCSAFSRCHCNNEDRLFKVYENALSSFDSFPCLTNDPYSIGTWQL